MEISLIVTMIADLFNIYAFGNPFITVAVLMLAFSMLAFKLGLGWDVISIVLGIIFTVYGVYIFPFDFNGLLAILLGIMLFYVSYSIFFRQ